MLSTGIVGLQHAVAHVSNWWPGGQMWLATTFYVAREILILTSAYLASLEQ